MSCPKWLLDKKGPLATVWVAAFRRMEALTREQVASTDIIATIDKISQDAQAPQRILALLLLGIVKIYCKKAQYLYDDCSKISHSFESRCCAEPSTGRSVQVKEGVEAGHQKVTNKVNKSIHTMRTTKISSSISSEGIPARTETEIHVQTSVVVREACVSVDVPAFTIPERFELDSFDLGIADDIYDDGENNHQLGRQDISLEDERSHAPFLYEFNQRAISSYAVDSCCPVPEYISLPPEVIGAISEVNNILDFSTNGHEPETENQNVDSVWFTPVKDVLPPEMVEIMAEGKDPSNKSKMCDESIRKVNMDEGVGSTCSFLLQERQERQISENVLENMTSANLNASCPTIEELENGLFLGKSDAGPHVGGFHGHETEENELLGKSNTGPPVGGFQEHEAEDHGSLEPPVLSCKTQAINDLSPSTPEPLPEGIPEPPLSSTFMVRTPAKIERQQSNKKRKRKYYNKEDYLPTEREEKRQRRRLMFPMLDEVLILSNDMMSIAIKDASDLTRTKKKAPHTFLGTWKVAKIGSLLDNFMDPLIPYQTPVNLAGLPTPEAPETSCGEPVKARRRLSYKLSESSHSCNGATERESFDEPRKRKLGGPTDFEAPIDCCTESGHLQDDVLECNDKAAKDKDTQVKGDEYISVIQSDKELHESENHTSLHNEAFHAAPYNIDELQDSPMDEEHTRDGGLLSSIRARKIARFLQLFLDRNSNQGTNSLSLNHALEGKDRRTSAIFFYETLVLKSRGLMEVNQEQPYEDIMLSPTPQFEAELQRPCGGTSC